MKRYTPVIPAHEKLNWDKGVFQANLAYTANYRKVWKIQWFSVYNIPSTHNKIEQITRLNIFPMIMYQQLIVDEEALIMEMRNHNLSDTLLHIHLTCNHKNKIEEKENGLHPCLGEYWENQGRENIRARRSESLLWDVSCSSIRNYTNKESPTWLP